jgi:hypothetical protein
MALVDRSKAVTGPAKRWLALADLGDEMAVKCPTCGWRFRDGADESQRERYRDWMSR